MAMDEQPQNPGSQVQPLERAAVWGARLSAWATWLYAAGLALLLGAMEWIGERNWLVATCLYVPAQAWLLPLLVLAPVSLAFQRRLLWWHLGCCVFVLFIYMDPEWSWRPPPRGPSLVLMTNNIGQNNRQSITEFLREQNPDIVLLQEARARGSRYQRSFPEYQMAEQAEFVMLSKFPIMSSQVVELPGQQRFPVAARFEIEWQGRRVAVYSVHLPTPRRELFRLRGAGLLIALAGIGQEQTAPGRFRREIAEAWANRIELARALLERLKNEPLPFLVAGDFNMPNHGFLYRMFSRELVDAFEKRGRGYGFTFPGYSLNPLTGFGPWLRIDYCFAGHGFTVTDCRTESGRRSQHRAVAARFEPDSRY